MEIQQSHICRFFQNFSSVNKTHPGKFLRKQEFFFVCVVPSKHRTVVEAGKERFTTGASYMFKYQLSLFYQKEMKPRSHPHPSLPAIKAAGGQLGFGSRACRRCGAAEAAKKRQMPDRGAAPRLAPQLRCQAPGAAPSSWRLLSVSFMQ